MLELRFNSESKRIIEEFIISRVEKAKANGVVLGLSGGIDSSLVAKLCASALGNKNVLALIMPFSDDEDIEDAIEYAKKLGIRYKIISIDEILKACKSCLSKTNKKSIGNLKARIRMLLLYAYANSKNLIVVGTGNKTELLCGYFTKFGDGGADILPIGDLYKTQVRGMARFLEIPEKIINKVPSAGLWKGQTDEGELGIKYEKLDKILYGIELGLDKNEISNKVELPIKEVERIMNMVELTKHKRKFPLIPKIGYFTVGFDWKE